MKGLLLLLLSVATIAGTSAREEALLDGVSPDRRYKVTVEQRSKEAAIYYIVRDRRTGEVRGRIKSSYQPTDDGGTDFAWDQSKSGETYWRRDARYVAIDESNHQRMGTVIMARRLKQSSFRRIPISADALMDYTRRPWDRGRLFFGDGGFLPRDRASISLIGLVRRSHDSAYDQFECEVILDLRRDGKIVKAVFPRK